jgi:hypothetical protein
MSVIPISRIFIGKDMESRLVYASEIGDLSTVKKLLKFKVNPNARDEYQSTERSNRARFFNGDILNDWFSN